MSCNTKVAIIEPVGGHGGMLFYDMSLLTGLSKLGVHAKLYTCDETVVPQELKADVRCFFNKIYGKAPKAVRSFRFLSGLIRSLLASKLEGCRIVHFHFFQASFQELVVVVLSKLFGYRIVITAHDVESFAENNGFFFSKLIYSSARSIIAHSKVAEHELIHKLQIAKEKITIIPHGNYIGYNSKIMSKEEAKSAFGILNSSPVLLFFGQIKKVKGLDVLLKALPIVIAEHPDIKLIIAGKVWHDDFSHYQKIIDSSNLTSNVILKIGYIDDSQVTDYFKASDICILPYKKIYQSGVMLLSMSNLCPVLSSDIDGFTEVIENGRNGVLFKAGNQYDLALNINRMLANKQILEDVAISAYNQLELLNSWDLIAQQTINLYNGKL